MRIPQLVNKGHALRLDSKEYMSALNGYKTCFLVPEWVKDGDVLGLMEKKPYSCDFIGAYLLVLSVEDIDGKQFAHVFRLNSLPTPVLNFLSFVDDLVHDTITENNALRTELDTLRNQITPKYGNKVVA